MSEGATDSSPPPGAGDPDEQGDDRADRSPAERAQERQEEMEESGQENPT